jgi:hypothetical protein
MKELEIGLLKNIHEQFAENQNHHQAEVFKFIAGYAVFITVYIYATLYQKEYLISLFPSGQALEDLVMLKGKFIVTKEIYIFLSVLFFFISEIAYCYVCQIAYGFRRDQIINNIIRKNSGHFSMKLFSKYGNPKDKFLWPPDFYITIISFLYILNSILIFWVPFFLRSSFIMSSSVSLGISLILFFIYTYLSLYILRTYRKKCNKWITYSAEYGKIRCPHCDYLLGDYWCKKINDK